MREGTRDEGNKAVALEAKEHAEAEEFLQSVFSEDILFLNCKLVPNARAASHGYSECGYTKAASDACTSSIFGLACVVIIDGK